MRYIWIMSERLGPVHLLQLIYYPLRLQCNVNKKDENRPKYHVSTREWGFYVQKLCDFIKFRVRDVSCYSYIVPLHYLTNRFVSEWR